MRHLFEEHRRAIVTVGLLAVAAIVFVLVWFQPQKLFLEQTVDEALPEAESRSDKDPGAEGSASRRPKSRVLVKGSFHSLEHETSGRAAIVELADGRSFLRFDDLETSNGPDLRVYLSEIPVSDDWHAYGERFVDLGALKGNVGSQNYEIPDDVDIGRYQSAVIWCRRFTVGFGVAGLS
jgi:hypothetical protein